MTRPAAVLLLAAGLALPAHAGAQTAESAVGERVMAAVRAAMAPALPFPASDADGVMPSDDDPAAPWMVRPHAPGDRSIEILANPLNPANQQRAVRAMAQIQASLEAAQRKSEAQYERALAEAKRTGRSQDVDGVTLADEGVAGDRADADAQVIVDVAFNQPTYRYAIRSGVRPAPSRNIVIAEAVSVVMVPSNVYRDTRAPAEERYCAAETLVFLGGVGAAGVDERGDHAFDVAAAETADAAGDVRSIVVRLRGNDALIAAILTTTDWAKVAAVTGS